MTDTVIEPGGTSLARYLVTIARLRRSVGRSTTIGRSVVAGLIAISCFWAMPTRAAGQDSFAHSGWTVSNDAQPTIAGELPELTVRMMVPAGGLWQTPVRVRSASR